MTELATTTQASIQPIIELVTNAVTSIHNRRAYSRALTDFMAWHSSTGQQGLTKGSYDNQPMQYKAVVNNLG